MEHELIWDGQPGPSVLRLPDTEPGAGLVALHGSSDGRARQPLFDHLAAVLAPAGVAVLSYDRRPAEGGDVPLSVQADDAVAAMRALRAELDAPVGVFGFSQGAWAASLAAASDVAGFLVVLGCSGVSPAAQMRFYTDEVLRRRGYSGEDRRAAHELRLAAEAFLRSAERSPADHARLARQLAEAAQTSWFEHAGLPPVPPPGEVRWDDMDHDPLPSFAAVHVPVLAMWGADEECVPRETSQQAWRQARPDATLVDLPGCGHWPALGSSEPGYSGWETDPIAPELGETLVRWLRDHVLRD